MQYVEIERGYRCAVKDRAHATHNDEIKVVRVRTFRISRNLGLELCTEREQIKSARADGGYVAFLGGNGSSLSGLTNNGGNIYIAGGAGSSAGVAGNVLLTAKKAGGFQGRVGIGRHHLQTNLKYLVIHFSAVNLTATGTLSVSGNTTLAAATTTSLAITGLANTFLAVDGNGSVIATTTPSGGGGSFDMLSNLVNTVNNITGTSTATVSTLNYVTGGSYTVDLPLASSNAGKLIGLRMGTSTTAVGIITVQATSTDLIDGQSSRIMWANETATLYSDGLSWTKIAGKTIAMTAIGSISGSNYITGNNSQMILPLDVDASDPTGQMYDSTNQRLTIVRPGTYDTKSYVTFGNSGVPMSVIGEYPLYGASTHVCNFQQVLTSYSMMYMGINCSGNFVGATGGYVNLYVYQANAADTSIAPTEGRVALTEIPSW